MPPVVLSLPFLPIASRSPCLMTCSLSPNDGDSDELPAAVPWRVFIEITCSLAPRQKVTCSSLGHSVEVIEVHVWDLSHTGFIERKVVFLLLFCRFLGKAVSCTELWLHDPSSSLSVLDLSSLVSVTSWRTVLLFASPLVGPQTLSRTEQHSLLVNAFVQTWMLKTTDQLHLVRFKNTCADECGWKAWNLW